MRESASSYDARKDSNGSPCAKKVDAVILTLTLTVWIDLINFCLSILSGRKMIHILLTPFESLA
jgi:hypothetical protein